MQERALGVKVIQGVSPDQQLVKVVHDELLQLLGGEKADLARPDAGPRVILLAGLQVRSRSSHPKPVFRCLHTFFGPDAAPACCQNARRHP